jgi:tripartite-type tricarboxylate transporter receptor subunit TctC
MPGRAPKTRDIQCGDADRAAQFNHCHIVQPADFRAKFRAKQPHLRKASRAAEVRQRLGSAGADPLAGTPPELARMIREETVKWAKVARDAALPVD